MGTAVPAHLFLGITPEDEDGFGRDRRKVLSSSGGKKGESIYIKTEREKRRRGEFEKNCIVCRENTLKKPLDILEKCGIFFCRKYLSTFE